MGYLKQSRAFFFGHNRLRAKDQKILGTEPCPQLGNDGLAEGPALLRALSRTTQVANKSVAAKYERDVSGLSH